VHIFGGAGLSFLAALLFHLAPRHACPVVEFQARIAIVAARRDSGAALKKYQDKTGEQNAHDAEASCNLSLRSS
jgi:hypothetical protein